jgi:acyl transferase domain-containing protein/NADPH:quinone reductase-like Zn-dependent oxidoreductase/ubiquinone/menaquinone biosynthesis C-methylase UbiE/acyl carrier protein
MPEASSSPSLTPLQRAFLALEEARARVAALEGASREPIAIVGLGLRAPGGVTDADSFWRLLADGIDAIGPVPADRWPHERYYDPDPDKPGRIATRNGGFVAGADRFDAAFFGISPREADAMDPQQRLLLTVAWEALENAGQAPDQLDGSRTGVFVGVTGSDYAHLQLESADDALFDGHFASGIAHSMFSGRLSYLLGLQGPSLTVDTACSSSLVGLHLAVQALRNNECRMALAGGVNLILGPTTFVSLSRARMLAPDGRCKAFAATADGFSRAEGCGVLVLKRLSDARADGDRVLAVVRGSSVNQDGASSSLTAPNGPAQEAVIREALARAGVKPDDVSLLEAHGTGTQLGDPIEAIALGAVFGEAREPGNRLMLGSVKTNIGHAEAAAGVLGVIKIILALRHAAIPAHLHFDTPSPHIPWASLPFRVPTKLMPWNPPGPRIAGVSSFGFSGTNAHIVLAEAPEQLAQEKVDRPRLLALSARDDDALRAMMQNLSTRLRETSALDHADIVRTINRGRAQFPHRAAVVALSSGQAAGALRALAEGNSFEGSSTSHVARSDPPRIAFLFTGQGSQYREMSKGLYEDCPVFRDALDRCATLLQPMIGQSLIDLLFSSEGVELDRTEFTQPALFAVEYALSELWRSWGLEPSVVMGHSIGEYVAATVAGVFELSDALRLVSARGRLMQSLPRGGGMAAVFAPEASVSDAIRGSGLPVSIAAENGPMQVVISGPAGAVDDMCATLAANGVKSTRLAVSHAFHSALVEPVMAEMEREAARTRFSAPRIRLISNVTGRSVSAAEIGSPSYWRDHMRVPVRFGSGLRTLAETRPDICIEIGPNPALLSFASAVFDGPTPLLLPSLRKGRPDLQHILGSLAQAYLAGATVNWQNVASDGRVVDLPGYPLRPERHWFRANPSQPSRRASAAGALPGDRLTLATGSVVFEARIGADQPAFVRQHRVQDRIILPGTVYLAALADAGRLLRPGSGCVATDISIVEAMLIEDNGSTRIVQTILDPDGLNAFHVRMLSRDSEADGDWTLHLSGRLAFEDAIAPSTSLREAQQACSEQGHSAEMYDRFAALGLEFGSDFRTVRRLSSGVSQALGEIVLDELTQEADGNGIHPVLLDGCLQVAAAAMPDAAGDRIYLPMGIGAFRLHKGAQFHCFSHVRVRPGAGVVVHADVTVYARDGVVVATLDDVQFTPIERGAIAKIGTNWLESCLYDVMWQETPATTVQHNVFDPAALVYGAAAALPRLTESAGIPAYDAASDKLNRLCEDFVARAIGALGIDLRPGTRLPEEGLAESTGVVPRHRRLFRRFLAILVQAGMLAREQDGWRVLRAARTADLDAEARKLLVSEPSIAAELEITARVAPHLADALRGRKDEADLLFPKGSTESAERLYRDSPTAKLFNGMMEQIAAAVCAARAEGRTLRVLEVGGGTGATTAYVLRHLSGDFSYTFTDIGPMFVTRARERFGSDGRVLFATLDLEHEPARQGFLDRDFDLVIASNVIHATADLRRTLARLRNLMAPGGLLAMLEVTEAQHWFDLTVGLTEGWWAFTDTQLRPDYPTLTRAQWLDVLASSGYEAIATLPKQPAKTGILSRASLFLARAKQSPWLLFDDEGGTAAGLAERLRQGGARCILVRPGSYALAGDAACVDVASASDYRRLLDELAADGDLPSNIVHAWSLGIDADAPPDQANGRGIFSAMLLAQSLLSLATVPRLWILTRGAQHTGHNDLLPAPFQATVWGLGRSLALEHPELRCTCVDIDGVSIDALAEEVSRDGAERDVVLRAGDRWLPHLRRWPNTAKPAHASAPWRLVTARPGTIELFERVPMERKHPGHGEVEIEVEASGLNFKDVLNALGLYPGNPGPLGAECSGRVAAIGSGVTHVAPGDAVMAVAGGALASHVIARAELVQRRSAEVSAPEAATFPIAFLTASFCLDHVGRLSNGESVLIHAATGGVGLAAVQLAQRIGAHVIATAGTPAKRALLRDRGIEHVFDSRSASFADDVLKVTAERGVDVVLNSLAGDLIEPSFRAIADGGRFIEIGKRGIKSKAWVDGLGRGIRYDVVDWGETANQEPLLIGRIFERLASDFAGGRLTPLPRHEFGIDQATKAFRLMAQAGHIGRIAIRHDANAPRFARRDGTYLITGGLSGLGLDVARHLAREGAGRLVLISRRQPTEQALHTIEEIRGEGTDVVAEPVDVTDAAAIGKLLSRIRTEGPPLRGVLHAAGVLVNGALLRQSVETFRQVLAPKVEGAAILDRLTRGDALDWFVMFSSIAAILGGAGQANHAAANAYLDQLAWQRQESGLPGVSINWGAWSEVGSAADLSDKLGELGVGFLTPSQGLMALHHIMQSGARQLAVLPIDWEQYRNKIGATVHSTLLSHIGRSSKAASRPDRTQAQPVHNFRREVDEAPLHRRRAMVLEFVRERLVAALGLEKSRPVDPQMAFGDMGLDSLLSVELRNVLGLALGCTFPATLLFDYPTINSLSTFLIQDCWGTEAPSQAASPRDTVADIEDLSEDDVDRLLKSKFGVSI